MPAQSNIAGTTSGNFIKLDNQILAVYSREILFQAQPNLRFASVFQRKEDLMATPGNQITFLRYNPLTGKSELAETTPISTQAMSTGTTSIGVTEHGIAIQVSELLLRQSCDDVMTRASQLLGMHYAKDMDRLCRDTLLTSANVLWAKNRANRAALTATDYFDVSLIRDSVEQLAIRKAPKFGDAYICFVHPHQSRRLKDDPAWVNITDYAQPGNFLTGEIGRIDDVRFVESTMVTKIPAGTQNIWGDNEDTGDDTVIAANANTDVYQSVIVGDYCAGLAVGLDVEMRDNGVQDFGRQHALAYYGIWGTGLIESGHVAVLETA